MGHINKELDIYIPDLRLAFEFNGIYWHSDLYKPKNYHLNKTELCEERGIQLIHIWEDDWLYRNDIIKSMILSKMNTIRNKIYARKCQIKEINDIKLIREFLDKNHINGFVKSSVKVGLYYENELVSLMVFDRCNKENNEYELVRFCSILNTNVIGAASKLLKYFINNYKPYNIVVYVDRSYSNGNLYKKLGFSFIKNVNPNCFYYDKRLKMKKDKIGCYRVYNSGKLKYDLKLKDYRL